jgi:PPE-repeat protein
MAMAIIFIVGLVLMYSLIDNGMDKASVGNLASLLAGAVTTIIGFYFGTRAVEGQTTPSTAPPTTQQPPTKGPKIKKVSPDSGKSKDTVKISGESFGNDQKESKLLLGNTPIIPSSWKDSDIEFSIPDEQTPGQTKIEVVVNGRSEKVDFNITQ